MQRTLTTEQLTDRWEDQRDIKNLMGKYASCILLNRAGELFDLFWSQTAQDVCLGLNDGWYVGVQAVRDYYEQERQRAALVTQLIQKRFPDQFGG